MDDFLDDKEKKYLAYFGEPVLVAHDVCSKPHIDIYIFTNQEETQYFYLTKGLDESGFRELLMATDANEKWPVYFLQSICNYLVTNKQQIKEMETFENKENIKEANGFNFALFSETTVVGFNKEDLTKELGLINHPLYVFPITKSELEYSLKNNIALLLEIICEKTSPVGSVKRETVV